jgi:hypothetical protein
MVNARNLNSAISIHCNDVIYTYLISHLRPITFWLCEYAKIFVNAVADRESDDGKKVYRGESL